MNIIYVFINISRTITCSSKSFKINHSFINVF